MNLFLIVICDVPERLIVQGVVTYMQITYDALPMRFADANARSRAQSQ